MSPEKIFFILKEDLGGWRAIAKLPNGREVSTSIWRPTLEAAQRAILFLGPGIAEKLAEDEKNTWIRKDVRT